MKRRTKRKFNAVLKSGLRQIKKLKERFSHLPLDRWALSKAPKPVALLRRMRSKQESNSP
jgi:hypothetical protein